MRLLGLSFNVARSTSLAFTRLLCSKATVPRTMAVRGAFTLAIALSIGVPRSLSAQVRQPIIVEMNLGRASATGGHLSERVTSSFDLFVGRRYREGTHAALLIAGVANLIVDTFGDEDCVGSVVSGGCYPDLPDMAYASALIGAELRNSRVSIGALVGPSVHSGFDTGFGGEARLQLAAYFTNHVGMVFTGRHLVMPDFQPDLQVKMRVLSIGFRVH